MSTERIVRQSNPFANTHILTVNPPKIHPERNSYTTRHATQSKERERISSSNMKYIPFFRKVVEYEDRQRIERIPKRKRVIDYQERVVVENVPREVVVSDYYAVEKKKEYVKEVITERKMEMIPKHKVITKMEYLPVQKQIIHYPEQNMNPNEIVAKSIQALSKQGIAINPDAEYKKLDPQLIYKYSKSHGDKPVGYVEDGCKRNLSTAPSKDHLETQNSNIKILSASGFLNKDQMTSSTFATYS